MIYVAIGPTFALIQNLVPAGMRALACAFLLFFSNLANLAVAPQLLGWASDVTASRLDDPRQSLRWVLAAASVTALWAAWHYVAAVRSLRRDLTAAGAADPTTEALVPS
ncbi:MAG TPA: hypothetical protein VKS60_11080, partial [Stellaceae bacterium]|nr:hypothetical protein [Stellaceae bacterium]